MVRTVIVTGAAGGIGGAIAARFAGEGARLALIDRAIGDEACRRLHDAGAAAVLPLALDVGDAAALGEAFDQIVAALGAPAVLVNVAGMMLFKPLAAHDAADWHRLLAVNLVAPALLSGRALGCMAPGSAIVNIASVHARRTSPDVAAYAASKAALVSLTRSTAIEGKPLGIRCNAVLPGAIDTAMLRDSPNIRSGKEVIDPRDIGTPDAIAAVTAFLASPEAGFITGEEIVADGGRMGWL